MRFWKQIRMLLATMIFIDLYSNPISASELTAHAEQTEPYVTVADGWISRKKVNAIHAIWTEMYSYKVNIGMFKEEC